MKKKRILISFLFLVVALVFCACQDNSKELGSYYVNESVKNNIRNQGNDSICWAMTASQNMDIATEYKYPAYFSSYDMYESLNEYKDMSAGGNERYAMAYYSSWMGPKLENTEEVALHIQDMLIYKNKSIDEIKEIIKKYGCVETNIFLTKDMLSVDNRIYNQTTAAYNLDSNEESNHTILVIGWDDKYSKDNFVCKPNQDGAFICVNSWGNEAHDNGLFYVSYESLNFLDIAVVYSVGIENVDNYSSIYQTEVLGWHGNFGYDSETCWFSNIYTLEEDGAMLAVGFYTANEDSSYEVYIVEDFEDLNSFSKKNKVASGEIQDMGYHTISFEHLISGKKNEKVAVVVKLTTKNCLTPVCVNNMIEEKRENIRGNGFGCLSKDGESWVYANDIELCLKLYLR